MELPFSRYSTMFLRFIIGLGYAIAAIVIGGLIAGGFFMSSALPTYSGSIAVPGLSSSLTIERDDHGVPHIYAASADDAYFGLGFVHAQDRLFQMDFTRRVGEGRLSEVFGERTLLLDAWSRTIGFHRIAAEMWKKAGPETRRVLTAYANGINAYITGNEGKWGFEFDAVHSQPELWRPEYSLLIGRLMAWEMNFAYWTDAAFGDIALSVDSSVLQGLFPGYPDRGATVLDGADPVTIQRTWHSLYKPTKTVSRDTARPARKTLPATAAPAPSQRVPAPPPARTTGEMQRELKAVFAELRALNSYLSERLGSRSAGGGSNAFVIAPRRSATGGALLENDMHLQLGSPGRWHLAHISGGDLNVAGFCVPGLPAVLSGRNEDISWGVTNSMADESDFFIEKLDSAGRRYQSSRGYQKFVEIFDTIIVRDSLRGRPALRVPITARQTIHGPVISDIHPFRIAHKFYNNEKAGGIPRDTTIFGSRKLPISLTWNGLYALTDELSSIFGLHRARTIEQARASLRAYATPCLNICLADRRGNIAYQYIGRMPRRTGNEERILLPRDGSNPAQSWQGFVTMANLPSATNPPRGYLVSANNPPTRNRTIPFSNQWEPSARADRISQLIELTTRHDTASVKRIAMDITSPYDWDVVLGKLLALYPDPNPVRIEADSSFNWLLDSMQLAWRRDSVRTRGKLSDSAFRLIEVQDSIKLHRPWRDELTPIRQHPLVERALEYLRNWNGAMSKEEVAPAIYSVFLQRLIENTFLDDLGELRYRSYIYVNNVPLRAIARLLDDSANIVWDRATTRGPLRETRDSIIKYSFVEALKILRNSFGHDIKQWQWGKLHSLTYRHMFAQEDKRIAAMVNIESGGAPGSPTTVYQATYHLWDPYELQVGPSMRMIADMKTHSLYAALPTGNSEAVFSDHYSDMLEMFKKGDFLEVSLRDRDPAWRKLELVPAR